MDSYIFTFIIFSVIFSGTFGANILVVCPHISYSHFKATSKLATALEIKGHNVTLVSPYQMGLNGYKNITEISIYDIVDPIKRFETDFFQNKNVPTSYWSELQYAKEIGSQYASHVLNNTNVTDLINTNSVFDLVLLEDVSADALTIFSYIFKCPLVVLLSEPMSLFYNNYFSDNTHWKKYNELRNAHHYVIKELYREWVILPQQNKIIKEVLPDAPDIREILYNTSLVFIPSYPTLTNLIPKYPNVKQIGGFHIDNLTQTTKRIEHFNNSKGVIVISDDLKDTNLEHLFKRKVLQELVWTSNIPGEETLGHPNIKLFIGNGDIYETSIAIHNNIPVLGLLHNRWCQQFLIDTLIENKAAYGVHVDKLDSKDFQTAVTNLLLNITRYQERAQFASQIIRSEQIYPAIDEAVFWIEFVIDFHGASHLKPHDLQAQLNKHLIEIIIVLVIIDVVLFLIFYWIIKHLLNLFCPKKVCKIMRELLVTKNKFKGNISYIRLEKETFNY